MLMFLDHCNSIRRERLVALEKDLSDTHGVSFSYYSEFEHRRALHKNFSTLTMTLAILLTIALFAVMIATLAHRTDAQVAVKAAASHKGMTVQRSVRTS